MLHRHNSFSRQPTFIPLPWHSRPNRCLPERLPDKAVLSSFFNSYPRTTVKNLLLLICGVAALSACHKDDNSPSLSRTDLLTTKNWRVTASTFTTTDQGNVTVQDDYLKYLPCERDNFTKFNSDKTVVQNEGASKCNAAAPQSSTFVWAFNQDETQLLIGEDAGATVPFTIVELSATTLHLRTMPANSGSVSKSGDLVYTAF